MSNINTKQNERLADLENSLDTIQNERLSKIEASIQATNERLGALEVILKEGQSDDADAGSRLDRLEASVREISENDSRGIAEGAADDIATIRAEQQDQAKQMEQIRRSLGAKGDGELASASDVKRLDNEVAELRKAADARAVSPSVSADDTKTTTSFPRGLIAGIIETYHREDLMRYSRELENEAPQAE